MLAGHGLQAQARAQCSLLHAVLQPLQTAHPAQPLAALPQEQAVGVAAHRLSAGNRGPGPGEEQDRVGCGQRESGRVEEAGEKLEENPDSRGGASAGMCPGWDT